jgi:ABC-2 type transport system ATP-binding protein
MDSPPLIEVDGLKKRFGQGDGAVDAVCGVSFSVAEGEVYGLLGPNGAGKSTTILMLATLLMPTAGAARIAGADVVEDADRVRSVIGVTLQETGVDAVLTGRELLSLHARLYGLSARAGADRAAQILATVGLEDAADRRLGTYSGGMRRRLDLGLALVNAPRLVILDEPTTGLDPASRRALWSEIESLREGGTTILLSTQYLEEAERLADRVAIIDRGRLIAEDSPDTLRRRVGTQVVCLSFAGEDLARRAAGALGPDARLSEATVRVAAPDAAAAAPELIVNLSAAGIPTETVTIEASSLEDVFLTLTGDQPAAVQPERSELAR